MQLRFLRLGLLFVIASGLIAACQGGERTEFLMEVTVEVTRVVPVTLTPGDGQTTVAQAPPSLTPAPSQPAETDEPAPTAIPTEITPSPTPDVFPTPVVGEVIVAEQEFENGRLFYLDPRGEIWAMFYDDERKISGEWQIFPDNWDDTMPEMDPEIVPPAEGLAQPIRGFGLLWRENDDLRGRLGWAIDSEFGHVTNYRYEAGGEVINGEYVFGEGVHLIDSRDSGTTYIFDGANLRWSIAADPSANQP